MKHEGLSLATQMDSLTEHSGSESAELACSIGLMAHDEEANIAHCLEALSSQDLRSVRIETIVVISSGSTDATEEIVRDFASRDERIVLILEPVRRGKIAAVNRFFSQLSRGDIAVLINGDTIPERECIERLVAPFRDPSIGMTGARPIPVNDKTSFTGFLGSLFWQLHHNVALSRPKLGEGVAYRCRGGDRIPEDTIVDEAYLEHLCLERGERLCYVPGAVVYNKGPEQVSDFIAQHRRNVAGHIYLRRHFGHQVATMPISNILRALKPELSPSPKKLASLLLIAVLSLYARCLGALDYLRAPERHQIWKVARSTKRLRDRREAGPVARASKDEAAR